jgi:hypothetical protein
VKNIRFIMSSVAAVAALTTTSGFALTAQAAPARTADAHRVNWGDVTIPGQLCKVSGQIQLHNGQARLSHSGLGPLDVLLTFVTHGNLAPGLPVTALQIWCDNQGGTAAGQLAEGIFVYSSPGGHPQFLGLLTPQFRPKGAPHIPFLAVAHIDTQGHIATTEFFYNPSNADCCPSGRATTVWKLASYGGGFIPGHTKIIRN